MHKFPLVSKCGYIHKLVAEGQGADNSILDLHDIPGGAESFELAAKFCYGINFEITTRNVAMLRCAAEYLGMTEEYADGNLIARTEVFLAEVALKTLTSAVTVLQSCEVLLPVAEELNIVSSCVETIVSRAIKDSHFSTSSRPSCAESEASINSHTKFMIDWWAEDLVILRIDFYQRVIQAMKGRGLSNASLGAALMFYAQKSLQGLEIFGGSIKNIEQRKEHELRILIETIVSLLPTKTGTISVSFLCWLLRAALYLETTVACRLDLEQRIGQQLEQATLDDLLIPSFSYSGDTIFDVDTVHRIAVNFFEQEEYYGFETHFLHDIDSDYCPVALADVIKVARLLECYLAEVAPDPNMTIAKFISLAELIPEQGRSVDDGLYRAADIYLKAHPSLSEMECKRICSVMDCKKLSREACAHAAQNERLPVHFVVQVLYFEQQRLRNAMSRTLEEDLSQSSQRVQNNATVDEVYSPRDEFLALHQENQELKLEIAKMRNRLNNLEKKHSGMKPGMGKPPLSVKVLLNSVSKKFVKLNPFLKFPDSPDNTKPVKVRRHSIS
eukprot:TRINITY_DN2296_c0_g1_i5.p1 TRINITY_DN2296_c0_g1~~TRINITY_DN2296_c0_g1_i5.p1  ORF type:complete len:557 (-),score=115.81 TRINITY_DN2296_c0_g1_i5:348-2018(-)